MEDANEIIATTLSSRGKEERSGRRGAILDSMP